VRFSVVFLFFSVLAVFAFAGTRIGAGYRIPAESVDSAGGAASSVHYRLVQSCIGQATPPGRTTGGSCHHQAGIGECLSIANTGVLKWSQY
jgi:hypothetical protein